MVVLESHWNHANLTGPRPMDGFCLIDPPTQVLWLQGTELWLMAGRYKADTSRGYFVILDGFWLLD